MSGSVFSYTNFRTLLDEWFRFKKKKNPQWSIRSWAKHLGLSGPSMLTMILHGERNPGPELTENLVRTMKLSPSEAEYFRDLVELERVKDNPRPRVQVMERLARQRPTGVFQQLSREAFQAISRWYYYTIREMVGMPGFREDTDWIASRLQFRITPGEVRDAIRTLLHLGLLCRGTDGKLQMAGGHIETTSDIADEGIKRFHEQALENARDSIRKHPLPLREFYGTTLLAPIHKLPQAKELIRKFHQEFRDLVGDRECDSVYQLEVGFYPLAIGERK